MSQDTTVTQQPKETKEKSLTDTDRDGASLNQTGHSKTINNSNASDESHSTVQPEILARSLSPRDNALEAIRTWEQATIQRILQAKARKLERLDPTEGYEAGLEAVYAWEQSTLGRFHQEKIRRMARLPPVEDDGRAA